jgi:hypothetical protein
MTLIESFARGNLPGLNGSIAVIYDALSGTNMDVMEKRSPWPVSGTFHSEPAGGYFLQSGFGAMFREEPGICDGRGREVSLRYYGVSPRT